MSGFFDDASWVLIPEGIKEDVVYAQKPTNGLGDLTFTRASDATRTNSAGVIERTPWNLLQMSEMFSDSYWAKSGSSIGINTTSAPNNTSTADTLIENSALTRHNINRQIAVTSGTHTVSIYIKSSTRKRIIIREGGITGAYATFDATSGSVVSSGAGATASIQNVGNGWYRCIVAITFSTSGNATYTFDLLQDNGTVLADATYQGDGTSGLFIWGAQLVEGTDAKPYFATTNRQDVPRLHYRNADGSVSTCPRLLLEPQRTNSIRNSTMVGAVAGSPGTLPTNWGTGTALTQTIVGIGVENGLQYIDLRYSGVAANSSVVVSFEGNNAIAASNGQTWTHTFYAKLISAPTAPNNYNLYTLQLASGSNLGAFQNAFTPTSTLTRYTQTFTTNQATITHLRPYFFAQVTTGQTYDFTIRIAAPQMELGAYATTFIPTTTAAVTRLADAASKTGVSDLIGQTEGTLFFDCEAVRTGASQSFSISNGTTSQRVDIRLTSTNTFQAVGTFNSSSELNISGGSFANGERVKLAIAYKQNDATLYANGVSIGTDTSLNVVGTFSKIGFDLAAGTQPFNSPVNQAAIFTRRLTNAELAQLTTL